MARPNPNTKQATSLSFPQLRALAAATGREVGWGLRKVDAEVAGWRRRAEQIEDPARRQEALVSLETKRAIVEGAARFWSVPGRRDPDLLRLLVAFQVMANLLDVRSEGEACSASPTGGDLMQVLVEAVDLDRPLSTGTADDGGYVAALASTCRSACARLTHYAAAQPLLVRRAELACSLGTHHISDQRLRDHALEQFARRDLVDDDGTTWFERAAGPGSALTVIALLTLAADPRTTTNDLQAAAAAYSWVEILCTMLDSYADQLDDAVTGHVSFVGFYPDQKTAVERVGYLIDRSLRGTLALREGERHVVLVSMMIAMFLSRDGARSAPLSDSTRELIDAGGPLTRRLAPILRFWRVTYRQQAH